MLNKVSATAESLRRIALAHGILPEQGARWKAIAKKLTKVTSSKFPTNKPREEILDEVIPDRKIFKELAIIDKRLKKKYPTREISGFVDKNTGKIKVGIIGERKSTLKAVTSDVTQINFHKHPYFSSYPSKGDMENQKFWLEYLRDGFGKKNTYMQSLVYNADTSAAGITRHSSKINPKTGKAVKQIDYAYRVNPNKYNLRGLMKLDKNISQEDANRISEISKSKGYSKLLESELKNIIHSNGARIPTKGFPLKAKPELEKFDSKYRINPNNVDIKKIKEYDKQITDAAKGREKYLQEKRQIKKRKFGD